MNQTEEKLAAGKTDAFWHRVYASVILTTVFVIAALWLFSEYFS